MRKATIGMAAAVLSSVLAIAGASAAPMISHAAALKADPGVTAVAHKRAHAPVVRESRGDITSFSSSSGGVGVNHPPKK